MKKLDILIQAIARSRDQERTPTDAQRTAILNAASVCINNNDIELLKRLVRAEDINYDNTAGMTLLHHCAAVGNGVAVRFLVGLNPKLEAVRNCAIRPNHKITGTPLLFAVSCYKHLAIELQLQKALQQLPLLRALSKLCESKQMILDLLAAGADLDNRGISIFRSQSFTLSSREMMVGVCEEILIEFESKAIVSATEGLERVGVANQHRL